MDVLQVYFPKDVALYSFHFLDNNNQYYLSKEWKKIKDPMNYASQNGLLDLLQWTRIVLQLEWDKTTTANAAKSGNLKMLLWLVYYECPWDERVYQNAINNADIGMLEWAYVKRCPYNANVTSHAVKKGNLTILNWLHQKNFPFDWWASAFAVYAGHLHVLKWLNEHGYFWCNDTCLTLAIDKPEIETWIKTKTDK